MSDQINQSNKRLRSDWPGWPYLIIGLAVLLRVIHILNSRSNPTFWAPAVDPGWYDQTAQNIVLGQWGPFPLFRAPLYTTLLAAVYAVFGHDLVVARLLNVLFQGVAIWAVWRIGRAYFTSAVGIVAALLLAVNGTTIYFAGELVSSSAEMMVAALGLWATLRLTRDPGLTSVTVCGLIWGFAAITRPNFLFVYPVVIAAIVLLARIKPLFSRRTAVSVGVWLISAFIPILPITAANYFYGGEVVMIATQGGVNFWIGNNPESTGILSILPGYGNTWTMGDAESEAEREMGRPLKSGELSNYYYAKGWNFLKAHPGPAIRFMIRKTALFFNRFEISNNKHITHFAGLSPWLPFLIHLNFGILIPLGLLGFWIACRSQPAIRIIAGLLLCYAASVVLFFITARFRMPVVPWLVFPAAIGLVWIAGIFRKRPTRSDLDPLFILIPGIVIAYLNIWNLTEAPIGWARYMEGNAFLRLNQLDSAKVCFFDSIRDSNAVARSQLNLGVIAQRLGNNTEALYWYQEALKADSHNADIWNNLGTIQEASGDTLKALASYQKARALRPSAPDPRHNLAGIHFRLGNSAFKQRQDSLALRHFQECIALEPSAPVFHNLALVYAELGDMSRALASVERALQFDPYFVQSEKLRARLLLEMKATLKAEPVPLTRD